MCAGADCVTPLTPMDIDSMKQLAQRVTTTAGILAGPRSFSPEDSGSRVLKCMFVDTVYMNTSYEGLNYLMCDDFEV